MVSLANVRRMVIFFVLCLLLTACNNQEYENQESQGDDDHDFIENMINEILASTAACDGWAPSVVQMINTVFHDYTWDFNKYQDSDARYIAKFSGTYSPNPDIPNLSHKGSISYLIDIEEGAARIYSDSDGISTTFLVYIVR